jgi:RNA polymerase sigma-70 factor, ECF subfamily
MDAPIPRESVCSGQEARLIAECKAGNHEHFQSLVSPYLHSLKLISFSILKNSHDVEEVVQESILKAFTHIGQLREGDSFKAWLLQIAANEAKMRLRKDRKHLYQSVEQDINAQVFQPRQFVDWRNIPSSELERREIQTALTAALGCLDDGYREVFVLRDVQHLGAGDTARILGLTEGTVHTRLHRARMQMREKLTPLFQSPRKMSMTMPLKMMLLMGKTMLKKTISCRHVTEHISDYIDDQLSPELRKQIEKHLELCDRCSVLVDTTRKLLYVAGDEQVFDLPFECKVKWDRIVNNRGFRTAEASG